MNQNETQARLREIERAMAVQETEIRNVKSEIERLSTKEEVAHIKDDVKGILSKSWLIVSSIVMLVVATIFDHVKKGAGQ
jgi:uncharacterized coiled-coil protein SlyX|tara:strand:+ start:2683 stop:2922 length:240 start_codon:yes stop_codon:yes gene_type:complete